MPERIALVGFGEAGGHFGRGLVSEAKARVSAFDLRFAEAEMKKTAAAAGVDLKDALAPALEGAELVFSLVTASSAVDAAVAAAVHLRGGQTYVDFNSVSPMSKRAVAAAIARSGAGFVEAAIMAPVPGPGYRVPVLVAGPDAAALAARLNAIGMRVEVAGERIGDASLLKMLRSIFIKGIEALMLESLVAARQAGVEERILDSVQGSMPGINWRELTSYNLGRTVAHGARRAAEMRESAAALAELGLEPFVTDGIARRIEWAHRQLKDMRWPAGEPKGYADILDALAAKLAARRKREAAE
jgi:3-hydroxyisobutyrate dehydrogenase-like beta-hydroxyacid dehydrogenase